MPPISFGPNGYQTSTPGLKPAPQGSTHLRRVHAHVSGDRVMFGASASPCPKCAIAALRFVLDLMRQDGSVTQFTRAHGAQIKLTKQDESHADIQIDLRPEIHGMDPDLLEQFQALDAKKLVLTFHIDLSNGDITGYDSLVILKDNSKVPGTYSMKGEEGPLSPSKSQEMVNNAIYTLNNQGLRSVSPQDDASGT